MKRSLGAFSAALALLIAGSSLVSCGPLPIEAGAAWFVKGPSPSSGQGKSYQIPWPGPNGEYSIQRVRIESFNEPHLLRGRDAQIIVEPHENRSGGIAGEPSVGRFIESRGALVPADANTQQATVIYAHMENLRKLDAEVGADQIASLWPAKIGLNVNVSSESELSRNNAIYDGRLNAILIVPYSDTELPITMNGGVLAHEHFHAIFQQIVVSKLGTALFRDAESGAQLIEACGIDQPNPERITKVVRGGERSKLARPVNKLEYNRFLLRGLNEGLADFWGWVYTGDPNFIRHSLKMMEGSRALDEMQIPLPDAESLKVHLQKNPESNKRLSLSYSLGTYYARFLYALASSQSTDPTSTKAARLEIAVALLKALPAIAKEFEANLEEEFIAPDVLIQPLFTHLSQVSASSCSLVNNFIAFQHRQKSEEAKPEACKTAASPDATPAAAPAEIPVATPAPAPTPVPTPAVVEETGAKQ